MFQWLKIKRCFICHKLVWYCDYCWSLKIDGYAAHNVFHNVVYSSKQKEPVSESESEKWILDGVELNVPKRKLGKKRYVHFHVKCMREKGERIKGYHYYVGD